MNFLRYFLIFIGIGMMIIGLAGCINAWYAGVDVALDTSTYEAVEGPSTPTRTDGTGSEVSATPIQAATPTVTSGGIPGEGAQPTAVMTAVFGYHQVQPGETLYSIGRLYGISPEVIARSNGIANANRIYYGTTLYIPNIPSITPTPSPVASSSNNSQADNLEQTGETGTYDDGSSTTNVISSPQAVITESRKIQVVVPINMTLGESVEVVLTFNPKEFDGSNGSITVTPEATLTAEAGSQEIATEFSELRHYSDYNLFAVARLDAPGFNHSPATDVRRIVRFGEDVVYRWSIQPTEAEDQTLIISLWIEYEPKNSDIAPLTEGLYWNDAFVVEVRQTLFGLTASTERTISAAIGTSGIIPFVLGILPLLPRLKKDEEEDRRETN